MLFAVLLTVATQSNSKQLKIKAWQAIHNTSNLSDRGGSPGAAAASGLVARPTLVVLRLVGMTSRVFWDRLYACGRTCSGYIHSETTSAHSRVSHLLTHVLYM